jgi:membrane dipeptidase
MKKLLIFFGLSFSLLVRSQTVSEIHHKATLVDTHNDCLSSLTLEGKDIGQRLTEGHSDLYRWKEGGLDVQFFSIWTGEKARNAEGFFKDAMQEIDSLKAIIKRNPDKMRLATSYRDVKKGLKKGQLVSLIGVEGGHMIEEDMDRLSMLAAEGMRYLTLTWNNSTSWASSARDETERPDSIGKKGLNEFGKRIVQRMNQLGIIVDLSHVGEQTFYDAIATTTKPVILSHSSVWSICPVFRNVKDDQIKAVAKNGGVICINFYSGFIDSNFAKRMAELEGSRGQQIKDSLNQYYDAAKMNEVWRKIFGAELEPLRPTLSQMVDHIDHIVKLVGDDYVGIGSDYDGVSSLPKGLDDVTTYPKITEELLLRRGYSERSIKKILGENVLRVMKANFQ